MLKLVNFEQMATVLDLGGTPRIWESDLLPRLDITVLNLPGYIQPLGRTHHELRYVEGDACNAKEIADKSYDFVFSNSVIEHVGNLERRSQFAHEVRRLGTTYWVQTPSIWFPFEAHTGMPFWWFYPQVVRKAFLRGWRRKLPAWTEMIEGTTVVKRKELETLFPDGRIIVERVLGVPKSYIVVRT